MPDSKLEIAKRIINENKINGRTPDEEELKVPPTGRGILTKKEGKIPKGKILSHPRRSGGVEVSKHVIRRSLRGNNIFEKIIHAFDD